MAGSLEDHHVFAQQSQRARGRAKLQGEDGVFPRRRVFLRCISLFFFEDFSRVFHMVFLGFSRVFLGFSSVFSKVFLGFSRGFFEGFSRIFEGF